MQLNYSPEIQVEKMNISINEIQNEQLGSIFFKSRYHHIYIVVLLKRVYNLPSSLKL